MNFFTVAQSVPNDTFEKVHRHMLRPREHATRFSSPIHMYSNDLVWACAQDMAHLLETVVYERAKCMVGMRAWEDVAADISLACEEKGIGMLCTADQAASVAVKLTRRALSARFEKCAKAKAKLTKMREKAIQYISRTQLYLPPEGMSLWLYFQTQEHTIISRKSIGRKDQIARDTKEALKELTASSAQCSRSWADVAAPAAPAAAASVATSVATKATQCTRTIGTKPTINHTDTATQINTMFPGLHRGGKGGGGRGGAIPRATKLAVRDLITEDRIPARDVPKTLVDVHVLMTQTVPSESEITQTVPSEPTDCVG